MDSLEYNLAVADGRVAGLYCGMHAPHDWRVGLFEEKRGLVNQEPHLFYTR